MGKLLIHQVSLTYEEAHGGHNALKDINLTVEAGEFITLLGPSGCGKSTLLSLLAGLIFPTQGSIFLDGQKIQGTGKERGVVLQHYSLFPWMTAQENIVFGLKQIYRGKSKKELREMAARYLTLVGLEAFADKYPAKLSGGMQQRVAIARAFAMNPRVLLLDEPFGALDTKNRLSLQELLLELWERGQEKKTVVMVTHDVDEAILLSDRIVVLSAGPGTIKKIVKVDFPRPRNRAGLMGNKSYQALRNELINLFYDAFLPAQGKGFLGGSP